MPQQFTGANATDVANMGGNSPNPMIAPSKVPFTPEMLQQKLYGL